MSRFYCIFALIILAITGLVTSFTYVIRNERQKCILERTNQANTITIESQNIINKQQKEITKQNNKLQSKNNELNKKFSKDVLNANNSSSNDIKSLKMEVIDYYTEFEKIE